MTAPNVVPLRQMSVAEKLERLAWRPLQPQRDKLLMLAARSRALEAYVRAQAASEPAQLELRETA